MATLNYIQEHTQNASAMKNVIDYCKQDFKVTDPETARRYVTGINCDGENSYAEFMTTKKCFDKENGTYFYQYEQSFSPKENITPALAHEVALEFAERAWPGHEVMVATHCDVDHIHSHFVVNSVSYQDGSKLRQSPKTLLRLRALNDEICQAHGLSVLEPYTGGGTKISAREYRAAMKGDSWKFRLMTTIDSAMNRSGNRDDFIREMEGMGYGVRWSPDRKYITYTCPNGMKCRDIKLHEEKYRKEMMEREFQYRTNQQGARSPESGECRTHREDREGAGADSGDDTLRQAHGRDRIAERSVELPADVVYHDQTAGYSEGFRKLSESDNGDRRSLSAKNVERLYNEESADDRSDEGDLRTGWEESRAIYFGLHTGASNGTGQAQRGTGESQETNAPDSDHGLDHGNSSLGAGILSALPRAGIIEDDSEDEEERRKRIQAEQTGSDIGAAIGLAIGLISQSITTEERNSQTDEYEDEDDSQEFIQGM